MTRGVLAVLVLISGDLVSAQAPAGSEQPARLSYHLGALYPGLLPPQFVLGSLADGGCTPLYLEKPAIGCASLRGEPAWVDLAVQWSGSTPLPLSARGDARVEVSLKRPSDGELIWSAALPSRPMVDDRPVQNRLNVPAHGSLTFRTDLSALTRSLPAGDYDLCLRPRLTPPTGVVWDRTASTCYGFALIELETTAARLEALRRRAVDLLEHSKCAAASAVIVEMLDLDVGNAAAYRLRGIVAELDRRPFDAIADYTHAAQLVRAGDAHLAVPPQQRGTYVEGLEDWLVALQSAQGASLLPEGLGCR